MSHHGATQLMRLRYVQVRQCVLLLVVTGLLVFASTVHAAANRFEKGSTLLTLQLGRATAFGSSYTIYGVGVGYYVMDGLELGFDFTTWQGGNRDINEISPSVRYVIVTKSRVHPYIGGFYRKTKIESLDDLSAYGARYGIYVDVSKNVYLGFGGVSVKYQNCTESLYSSCSDSYTEFTAGFSF